MWVCCVSLCLFLVFIQTESVSNEFAADSVDAVEQNASSSVVVHPMPIHVVNNSSSNSTLMENQLQEQISLSNTSLTDLQNDNNTQRLQVHYRERKRQERLLLIQTQILHRLGITGRAMNSSNMNTFSDEERRLITRVVQRVPSSRTRGIGSGISGVNEISSSEIFAERLQSFYPACSFPNHSDPTLWNQNLDEEMRLYYDINFSRSSQTQTQTEISVVSAKLRLYKYNDPPLSEELPLSNLVLDNIYRYASQQGLSISIYQYMKPLRPNRREKKRLIDTRMIPVNHRGWIEFNVINALSHWQQNPTRNFGLYVEIEDPYGNKLNSPSYIHKMNCSDSPDISVSETPMPNLMDIYPDANETLMLEVENYPTLDLLTLEVSREEQATSASSLTAMGEASSRRKRLTRSHRPIRHTVDHRSCRREKLHISFKDLDLENIIIYPEKFETVICSGHCDSHEKESQSSCKPSNFQDLELVYFDSEHNPKIKKLKKFLPQHCQCGHKALH